MTTPPKTEEMDARNSKACVGCMIFDGVLVIGLWCLFGVLAWYDKPGWGWVLTMAIIGALCASCKKYCLSCDEYERIEGKQP